MTLVGKFPGKNTIDIQRKIMTLKNVTISNLAKIVPNFDGRTKMGSDEARRMIALHTIRKMKL